MRLVILKISLFSFNFYIIVLVSAMHQHKSALIVQTFLPSLASFLSLHPIASGHLRVPDWAPCATQQVLTSSPSYTWHGVYVDAILPIYTTLSLPLCVHRSILYIFVSIPCVWGCGTFNSQHQSISHSRIVQILAELIIRSKIWVTIRNFRNLQVWYLFLID